MLFGEGIGNELKQEMSTNDDSTPKINETFFVSTFLPILESEARLVQRSVDIFLQ
jgi:hypothetical protein